MDGMIDAFFIGMGIDPSGVNAGMDAVERRMQTGFKRIMTTFVAPLASALAFRSVFGTVLREADSVSKAAERLNVDAEALQAWGNAAKMSGGSAESFQATLGQLNRSVQQFKTLGTGRAKDIFEAMGITQASLKAAKGGTEDILGVMTMLAKKAEGMDKAQFNAFASRLGIDQATIAMLQKGEKGLEELIAQTKEYGLYSARTMERVKKFNDTLDQMKIRFKTAAGVGIGVMLPMLTWVGNKLNTIIKFMKDNETFVITFITGIAAAIGVSLIPMLKKLGAAVLSNPAYWMWALIAGAVLLVALAIDDLIAYTKGGKSAFEDFWKMFGTAEQVAEKIKNIGKFLENWLPSILVVGAGLKAIWNIDKIVKWMGIINRALFLLSNTKPVIAAYLAVTKVLGMVKAAIMAISVATGMNPIGIMIIAAAALAAAAYLVIKNWDKVKEALANVGRVIKDIFSAIFGWLADKFDWLISKVDKVKSWFGMSTDGHKGISASAREAAGLITPSMSGNAGQAIPPSVVSQSKQQSVQNDTEINIAHITVETQATDANGIAKGIKGGINKELSASDLINASTSGVYEK